MRQVGMEGAPVGGENKQVDKCTQKAGHIKQGGVENQAEETRKEASCLCKA